MTARIFDFPSATRHGPVHCKPIGMYFPEVYRLQGHAGDEAIYKKTGRLVPEQKLTTTYTLSHEDNQGLLNPVWKPISKLDDNDSGWLVVAYLCTKSEAEGSYLDGYLDGLEDSGNKGPDESFTAIFMHMNHFFSIIHHPAPAGQPEQLLIYRAWVSGDRWYRVFSRDSEIDADVVRK